MRTRLVLAFILALSSALVVAAPVAAADTRCGVPPPATPDIQSGTYDNVIVPSGTYCVLDGATVRGNVTVKEAATVEIIGSTVGGNVTGARDAGVFIGGTTVRGNVATKTDAGTQAFESTIGGNFACDGCFFEDVYDTTVHGNVTVSGAELGDFVCRSTIVGNLVIRDSSSLALQGELGITYSFEVGATAVGGSVTLANNEGPLMVADNGIGGNLVVTGNDVNHKAGFPEDEGCGLGTTYDFGEIARNQVGGNLQVTRNTGPMEVTDNYARGNLECSGNTSPPTGGGNIAARKQGQCRNL